MMGRIIMLVWCEGCISLMCRVFCVCWLVIGSLVMVWCGWCCCVWMVVCGWDVVVVLLFMIWLLVYCVICGLMVVLICVSVLI